MEYILVASVFLLYRMRNICELTVKIQTVQILGAAQERERENNVSLPKVFCDQSRMAMNYALSFICLCALSPLMKKCDRNVLHKRKTSQTLQPQIPE